MSNKVQGATKITPHDKSIQKRGALSGLLWVNPSLNTEDREWLDVNHDQLLNLFCELLDSLGDDDKLSVKYDDYSGRWTAIYFGGIANADNAGCALSARGATSFDACMLLGYFHITKYARVWGSVSSAPVGRWG